MSILRTMAARITWGGTDAKIRTVLIYLATLLSLLSILGGVAAVGRHHGMEQRAQAMTPQTVQSGARALSLWCSLPFDSVGGEQVSVMAITPLRKGAPLPPGVHAWPRPGHAVLSPQLAKDLGGQRDRYGPIDSYIDRDTLITPTDRVAYLNPPGLPTSACDRVTRYGNPIAHGRLLALAYRPSLRELILPIGLLWFFPAITAVSLASGAGTRSRLRRLTLLDRLGANRSSFIRLALLDLLAPVVAALVSVLAVAAVASMVDVPLPPLRTVLARGDLRREATTAVIALLGAAAAILCAAVLSSRPRPARQAGGVGVVWGRVFRWVCLVAGTLACAVSAAQLTREALVTTFSLGVVLICVGAPEGVAWLLTWCGRTLARSARDGGHGARLVAGRALAADAAGVRRIAGGVFAGILLSTQLVGWSTFLGQQYASALHARAALPPGVVTSDVPYPGDRAEAFLQALPEGVAAIRADETPAGPGTVTGTCAALKKIELPCPAAGSHRTDVSRSPLAFWLPSPATIRVAAPHLGRVPGLADTRLVLVPLRPGAVSAAALQRSAYQLTPESISLEPVGEDWIGGGDLTRRQGWWVQIFFLLGGLALVVGASAAFLTASYRAARTSAATISTSGADRLAAHVAFLTVALPVLAASAAGLLAAWYCTALQAFGPQWHVPWQAPALCAGVGTMTALILWATTTRLAQQEADRWRPSMVHDD